MAAHLAARDVLNYRSRRKSAHILHFIVFEAYREGAFGVRLPTIDDDNVSEIVNPTTTTTTTTTSTTTTESCLYRSLCTGFLSACISHDRARSLS